ncbi:hypothetical protein Q31b_38610 [Novipirellula aureliae]|uniref:IncA protein n=1 Tax=Novipirellula aureliae TaxID=2527966 RepID=A0A5C6DNC6_9BACT|nr:hypothetical protein [Novipirellula aureliae]TWU38783.1 hypothetical protein Q31b_38610 [Novipirellula aureliae]
MSGRRRQPVSPSLFPFLAVLVCTLGTLILFLALVAQKATKTAEQKVAEATQQAEQQLAEADASAGSSLTAKTVDSMIAEEELRLAQVVAFRDEQAADLGAKRDHLTHIEDHLKRVRDELMRLSDEVKRATGEEEVEVIDEATIAFMKTKLEEEEKAVEKLKESTANQTPRVVIVPHKGPNGTDRRPIYLECTKNGIMLWPEGVRITPEQIEKSSRGANPIDAALRIVRHHCLQNYGDPISPYPLLVVRPNGIETYAAARGAMEDWDDQFGYELVPENVELAFNPPDPALKKRIDQAVQDAIANQQARTEISRLAMNGRGRYPRAFDGNRGSNSGARKPLPTLSAKQLDQQGRANGFHKATDGMPSGSEYYASSANSYSSRNSARKQSDWSTGNGTATNASQSGQTGSNANGEGVGSAMSAPSMQRIENDMEIAASELRSPSGLSEAMTTLPSGMREDQSAEELLLGSASGLRTPGDGSTTNGEMSSFLDRHHANPATPSSTGSFADSITNPSDLTLGQPDGSQPGSSTGSSFDSPDAFMGNESLQTEGAYADSDSVHGGNAQQGSAASGGQREGEYGAIGSPSAGGASSSAPAPSETQQSGSMSISNRSPNSSPNRSNRGENWAVPEHVAVAKGNQIVRTIRVVCYEDQFILIAPSTGGATEVFGFSDGNVSKATFDLGAAVRERISGWGPTFPGGRWQPVLSVEVMPGGSERFEQLQQLMRGSGVEVRGSGENVNVNRAPAQPRSNR